MRGRRPPLHRQPEPKFSPLVRCDSCQWLTAARKVKCVHCLSRLPVTDMNRTARGNYRTVPNPKAGEILASLATWWKK